MEKDHKEIGRELDLFHLEGNNPGVVFWHPKGATLYYLVVDHLRGKLKYQGYLELKTPASSVTMQRAVQSRPSSHS